MLIVCYFWLLALAMINRRNAESDPLLKMLRLHLGPVARWPWLVQLLLPLLLIAGLWIALHPLLVHLEITSPARSNAHLVGARPAHRNGPLPEPPISPAGLPLSAPDCKLRLFGDQPVVGFRRRHCPQSPGAASPAAVADCQIRFRPCRRRHSDLLPAALVAQPHPGPDGRAQSKPLASVSTHPPRQASISQPLSAACTVTVVAPPRSLWIDSVPPCSSVRRLAITSPKPSPCCSWILRSNCM